MSVKRGCSSGILALSVLAIAILTPAAVAMGHSSPVRASGHPMTTAASWIEAIHRSVVSESLVCSKINPNSSLNSTYASIYNGLPTGSGGHSHGLNSTTETNQSGYPNLTVGGQQLIDAWISICESSVYQALYNEYGAKNITSGSQLNGSTGHYQVDYGFVYYAACPSGSSSGNDSCELFTTWYVDLVTGSVDGPVTTEGGTPLGTPQTGGPSLVSILGVPSRIVYSLLAAGITAAGLGVMVVAIARRRGGGPPSSSLPAPTTKARASHIEGGPERANPTPDEKDASIRRTSAPIEMEDSADPFSDVY